MSDFLGRMRNSSMTRIERARSELPESVVHAIAARMPDPPKLDLHAAGFDLIAEVKRRAPSGGDLAPADDVTARAETYAHGGAAAISVLTEPTEFRGGLEDLTAASQAVPVPIMRKDFLVAPYQIFEARAYGAAGALVIIRMLDRIEVRNLIDAAAEARLFLLLEVFGTDDLEDGVRAVGYARERDVQVLLGVNTRDLTTLAVDPNRLATLAPALPSDTPRVAESGIRTPEDVERAVELGYRLALVGTSLMQSGDAARLTSSLINAGRAVIRRRSGSCTTGDILPNQTQRADS